MLLCLAIYVLTPTHRLDNLDYSALDHAATAVKAAFPHVIVEGSGGLTLANVEAYMYPSK